MSKPIGGSASLYIQGQLYSSTGEFSANILSVKKEEIISAEGEIFYSETPVASSIEGDILLTEKLKPQVILDAVDATVQVVLRSGRTVMLSGAFYSGDGDVQVKEGTMKIRFIGKGKHV